jgi:hypothetical protein
MKPIFNVYLVGFYAGLNFIAWIMVFCFVRETKQLTLEEIDRKSQRTLYYVYLLIPLAEVFMVPTKSFISYELKVWLPYFIKRHILRKNIMKPPPIIARAEKAEEEI